MIRLFTVYQKRRAWTPSSLSTSCRSLAKPPRQQAVMEALTRVFTEDRVAARHHRELLCFLASGESDAAAKEASALAERIKQFQGAHQPPGTQDVDEEAKPVVEEEVQVSDEETPLTESAECLRIVLLESLFETVDAEDNDSSLVLSSSEASNFELLDKYLKEEDEQWKAQRHLLTSTVLRVAKALRLQPQDLLSTEGIIRSTQVGLNPVRHANVVIRCEVPPFLDYRDRVRSAKLEAQCEEQIKHLKSLMIEKGTPLSEADEALAIQDLRRSKTVMRYSIGIHQSLQAALNNSKGVRRSLEEFKQMGPEEVPESGAEFFVSQSIRLLNSFSETSPPTTTLVEALGDAEKLVMEKPVIPFTFMLKCCLWFDVAEE